MVILEGALVVGLLGLLLYAVLVALLQPLDQGRPASRVGVWQVAHYDVDGVTRVVVERVTANATVSDEHVVAELPVADPGYDEAFLTAMATARQRQALFEAEDG